MDEADARPHVLFLDDEVGDPRAATVQVAIEALRLHFNVTTVTTLSQAAEEFRRRYYDAFVLDIDMRHADDVATPADQRGSHLARTLRSLDANTAVIMFSNMGRADDWLKVANCHVFGYIHKDAEHSIERLVERVQQAIDSPRSGWRFPQARKAGQVLVYRHASCGLSEQEIRDCILQAGAFEPRLINLDELVGLVQRRALDDVAAILFIADEIETRPKIMAAIEAIGDCQPTPHAVFALAVEDRHLQTVLQVINAHPFRLLNLNDSDCREALTKAIFEAAHWYGGNEIFRADDEAYRVATEGLVIRWPDSLDQDPLPPEEFDASDLDANDHADS